MADVQIAVVDQPAVQIAVIDHINTQIALAAPSETGVVVAVPGVQGPVGVGFPQGGTVNQLLVKQSNTNYDAIWTSALNVSGLTINDGTY
jgi:hypothetical protein